MSDAKNLTLAARVDDALVARIDAAGHRMAPGMRLKRSVVVRALIERGAASVESGPPTGDGPGDLAA